MMWICCQLGAREHYAVARALHAEGMLDCMVTEAWVTPGNPLGRLKRSLRERYQEELKSAKVLSWNWGAIAFELSAKRRGLQGWDVILARNVWFQRRAIGALSRWQEFRAQTVKSQPTFFAYSYAALELFRWAKMQGWRTVLGQIDPGPMEERLVAKLESTADAHTSDWRPAPADYWQVWREECALADRVVVNSDWSQKALMAEGVPEGKIAIVPLAYSQPAGAADFQREYPAAFTAERPLRVLFLGQVNLRKGTIPLIEAMRILQNDPIQFTIVGPLQCNLPADIRERPQVRWRGAVPRGEAAGFYQNADVFLFPTFSDGFGLTQLEAQAWRLPVIASRCCGEVVQHGRNGLLLPEVTAEAIAQSLRQCAARTELLAMFAENAITNVQFSLPHLTENLRKLEMGLGMVDRKCVLSMHV